MNQSLEYFLSLLGLQDTVFFRNKEGGYSSILHFDVQNKLKLINPDAIYIFNNQPLILFFDLSNNISNEREEDIHKKVWSFDNSPIAFVIKNDEIKVYNALNYIKKEKRLEEINLSNDEIIDKFSFWNLQSNNIWQWFQEEYIETALKKETKKRVNERLFQNIRDVRNALIDKTNDPEGSIPNSLILRLIFIRYLIDRNIEIGTEFIDGEDTLSRRLSFSKLLQDPNKLCQLFTKLNNRFNGVLFKDVDIKLTPKQAEDLSDIFKGEIPKKDSLFYGSDFYFEIFDFSIIPVEVISGIYESLIDPETRNLQSAVYTPSFLVDYILNDTIDVFLNENITSECKIFEVAVGSGIFLVQSLRRMIEKEIELNGNLNKNTFSERIRSIAKRNLFGIDINEEALKVTCFSIYIALLDYQEPKDINIYRFPNLLNENLFKSDFFDKEYLDTTIINEIQFDYILGNPPWRKDRSEKHLAWINNNNIYSKQIKGELEIAQSFLLRVKDFMESNTKVALIVTSTMFYNVSPKTKAFKYKFLQTYCLDKFLDLSPVRRLIFEEKDSPASVLYFKLSENNEHLNTVINHQSVKINYFLKYFKMLVIEKYDQKKIMQSYFIENDWMFKLALYGNTLDFNLLKKIQENISVNNFLTKNKANKGLGVIKTSEKSETKPKYHPELIGYPIIENTKVKLYYTPISDRILNKDSVYFIRGRKECLFNNAKILLKEQCTDESYLSISYQDQKSVYVNGVSGISFKDESLTKLIYSYYLSELITYYLFLTSCSWGVGTRPAVRFKDELTAFPFKEGTEKEKEKLIRLVDSFLEHFISFYQNFNLGEPKRDDTICSKINEVINNLYEIEGYEKDLVDYVLNVSRYQFQESKQHLITDFTYLDENHYRNRTKVLRGYAEVFLNEFGKIYEGEHIQVEVYPLGHFIAMNFTFHENVVKDVIIYPDDKFNEANVLEKLGNLSISQITNTTDPTKNLFIQKDIKGFEDNSFYIIKPNEYKCWHRAMAWYDVAEFKAKIEEAELESLNSNEDE